MKRFLVIFFVFAAGLLISQNGDVKKLELEADIKLKAENYEDALEDYLQLLTLDQKNEIYNYNAGVCYLNSNINKAKAVFYLEIVVRKEKHNPNADFLLGRAYQYANRYDKAIASFNKFKELAKGNFDNLSNVEQEIQYSINAKELIKFPVDVIFQSLGKTINSPFADYYPFVTETENHMVFNSKRPVKKDAQKMENGQYKNSIFISKVVNGVYAEADVIGEPVCVGNSGEEVIGMNANGDVLLIYKSDFKGAGKIYITKMFANGNFSKPELLPAPINSSGDEIAACVDNDGTTVYFASDRKGGFGGTDIYSCTKLPTGKWGDPRNCGVGINTPLNEDFPNLSPDGKTLFFSSKGHASMGGYDIFKATYDEEQRRFINPRNIGYPVNTSYDDLNFRISKSGKYGYVASVRGGGNGDYDIYRVSFNEADLDYTVLIGQLVARDHSNIEFRDVVISVSDIITKELIGNYYPNPANGRTIVILPPGKYILNVDAPGFKNTSMPIEILDKSSYQSEKHLFIELSK
ncbi:MAG: PD40 domain-containing protein [Sphingobacteriaceae bacterium]|nr:PD40 domain-containing protein [Sphingobacteriaceae bacterium]